MITIQSGKMMIPEEERFVGFAGDNHSINKQFILYGASDTGCSYTLYLRFDDDRVTSAALTAESGDDGLILTWDVRARNLLKSGVVMAQLKIADGGDEISHTSWDYFVVGASAELADDGGETDVLHRTEFEERLALLNAAKVDKTLTIAGVDLQDNVTSAELRAALSVPTKTSDLTNDSGFLTQHQDISGKVDKVPGKGLSANDYTTAEKTKLSGIDIDLFDKPADGSALADFNAENIEAGDIYAYLDTLIAKYPNYISKENLGKESSGQYDVNRYILFAGKYLAFERENYPRMFAWKNGSTKLYSVSVSPRIGDTLYSTAYIGTSAGTVSAVSNADESRTVNGTVYTRDKSSDVAPTLIYCKSTPDGYGRMPFILTSSLYDSSDTRVGSIATSTTDSQGRQVITCNNLQGNYIRAPYDDTNSLTQTPPTIVIIANEHGPDYDPAEPAIICCRVMKKMCEASGDEFIRFLRGCKVVFIPVANPWGFHTKKYGLVNRYGSSSAYMNYNGRNFHRNFDTKGWSYSGEGSGETEAQATGRTACYGGSEIETQYLMNTMYGATLGFAIHCMPTTEQSQGSMIIQSASIASDENFQALCAELWGKYQMFLTHSTDCDPESYSKPSSYAIANCTEGGAMFEMNRRVRFTSPMHDSLILRADYQEMAGVVKIFAKRAGIWTQGAYPDGDEVDW